MFKTVESGVGTEVFAFVDDAEMVENYSRFCETISYKKKVCYGKEIRSYPEVIFGHGFVWNDVNKREWEHADKMFKELLESWFALPAMPTGTSKWIKFSKR